MSKYKFNVGEKIFLLRSDNFSEEVDMQSLGTILDLSNIDETAYCYESQFPIFVEPTTSTGEADVEKNLHWEQIGLISDTRDWRIGQLIIFSDELEANLGDAFNEEKYGNIGYIFDINSDGDIKLLTPYRGRWSYIKRQIADEWLSPLTELVINNNYAHNPHIYESNKLRLALEEIGNRINFEQRDLHKCYACEDWLNPDRAIFLKQGMFLCYKCSDSYEYNCKICTKDIEYRNTSFRLFRSDNIADGEVFKVCSFCQDTRLYKCRGCSTVYYDKEKYFFNSDTLCFKCYDIACINGMTNPSRALNRSNISKLLLPDDKVYRINKSKTPVAIEIECVHDDMEEDEEEIYIEGYPKNWSDTYDGSITNGGREFMMMPEIGDAALRTVERFCDWALEDGWYTDNSCGIHVHTDAFYLGVSELKGIMIVTRALEPFIYKMLPRRRSKSRYSSPMSDNVNAEDILGIKNIGEFCNLWYNAMNDTHASTEKYNDSRYRGLNMHSRMLHGTIEYRYHHGSLNASNITNWMMLCLAMSDFGANFIKNSNPKIRDLFIKKESKDFSDYLFAMKAERLIPYVSDMVDKNNPAGQDEPPVWLEASEIHY